MSERFGMMSLLFHPCARDWTIQEGMSARPNKERNKPPVAKQSGRMARVWRDNGLTIVLTVLFVGFWIAQFFVGRLDYNEERGERQQPALTMAQYLTSAHFVEATAENWESEFLQMGTFVVLTVWLVQRGSAESRDPDGSDDEAEPAGENRRRASVPWPVRRGGWVMKVYENSLSIAFGLLFLGSMAVHAMGGARLHSEQEVAAGKHAVNTWEYLATPRFWFESFQNWQSEFLAILSMVVLTIWLRQRNSPESKRVEASHRETGK
jgi:hypothetical protein